MKIYLAIVACVLTMTTSITVAGELWEEPQDTTTAMNNPDLYAWQLFTALNWPGDKKTCSSDKSKKIGESGETTWELWPSKQETFLAGAKKPKSWKAGCRDIGTMPKVLEVSGQLKSIITRVPSAHVGTFEKTMESFFIRPDGPFTTAADEEVRLNKSAYEFIRDNKLYSLDEQERLAKAGVKTLVFPLDAKEVKAHWVLIEEVDKTRYHWTEIEHEGKKEIWGMAGLHIITRDMPRWFWSTFEHVDNEKRWPQKYPEGYRGWVVPSSDSASCPPENLACNKIPKGFGLEGTKWENYRLRGTQIDWVDHKGNPTVLPNSKIEGGFDQKTMSCITCHALAVKGTTGGSMPIRIVPGTLNEAGRPHGYIGRVDPKLFLDSDGNEVQYLGLDFIWSLRVRFHHVVPLFLKGQPETYQELV